MSSIRHAGVDVFVDIDRIRLFRDFRTVVDVGAHIGESASEFRLRAPHARIIAVEPVSANYAQLVKSTSSLGGITPVNAAVSSSGGQAVIQFGASSQTGALAVIESSPTSVRAGESVRMTTLDELMAEHSVQRIDFLKTDTEGHDVEVIRGASRLLKENGIDFVFSEVTFVEDLVHTPFAEMHDALRSSGFNLVGLYDIAIANSPGRIEYCNALFSRV